ncbi:hypothetical protein M427DRAFT_27482 [Gonapodya prolifera JEL478]|uniref:Potassium channel tetramerisation-type BTB domain-containing protein n=1 Tax=Gonapodya prolifera (strain JEL478) TaxID=1344416 RepID=A0A139AYX3_GONPJ|nr:hypothetical protein M427DRAFT_27482 [Gonapodya prolifera JEL478]|eukprot:KXS21952.1 hypothetical protein M427DRAFT_27482 [Gonapodya prolifera JEL478]
MLALYSADMGSEASHAMAPALKDRDGNWFIDRDPETFKEILGCLRTGVVPEMDGAIRNRVLVDSAFYGYTELEKKLCGKFDSQLTTCFSSI